MRLSLVLFIGLLIPKVVAGQDVKITSLQELIDHAVHYNYEKMNATLDKERANYQVKEAISKGLPQVSVSGKMDNYLELPTTIFPGDMMGLPGQDVEVQMGKAYNANVNASFNQLLFSQEFFAGVKAAKTSKELYELQEYKTEEGVIYQTASFYYQYIISLKKLQTITDNLTRMLSLQEMTQLMVDQQVALSTDLDRIKVDVTNLKAIQLQQEAVTQYQLNLLKVMAGIPFSAQVNLTPFEFTPVDRVTYSNPSMSLVMEDLTDIKLLHTQLKLQQLSEKVYRAGRYPTLAAYGQLGYDARRDEFNIFQAGEKWFDYSVIGLTLSIPITDGGYKRAKIKQERLKQEQTINLLAQTREQVYVENENALNQIDNSLKMLGVQEDNTHLARRVYNQTYLQYKEGIANLTDLLNAETGLRDSELSYYQSYLNFKLAELNLWKTQGVIKYKFNIN
ncbi:TolC family protein [Marinilabiliaceae bacterium JC017]|nr:TolC family protein [Marinilabiliaceae bacterium JC017]